MKKIRFNICYGSPNNAPVLITKKDGSSYYTNRTIQMVSGGDPMPIIDDIGNIDVTQLANTNKECLPMVQMFDSGYRVSMKDVTDPESIFKNWNGCVYVDLDTKKYHGKDEDKLNKHFKEFFDYSSCNLRVMAPNNFYFSQISHSGNSVHYVFYYDCEKNAANFEKCALISEYQVKRNIKILLSKIADELIAYPGVMDTCGERPTQPLFISGHPLFFYFDHENGRELSGEVDFSIYDKIIDEKENFEATPINDITFEPYSEIELRPNVNVGRIRDWSHPTRWSLLKIFCMVFKDNKTSAVKLYEQFIPLIQPYIRNHNSYQLLSLFRGQYNETLRSIKQGNTRYTNLRRDLLDLCRKAFGFNFQIHTEFKPQRREYTDYNETIQLKGDETLSNYIDHIINLDAQVIHVEAGCGLGKTYSAKEYVRTNNLNEDIFNLKPTKRVCFITPMTSINRDNFDDEESQKNWIVADSAHKGWQKMQIRDKSVCTTWNSFCKYELWRYNFDVYMFDEAHSLYMYDYRIIDIENVFKAIDMLKTEGKKIVFFTGTPSLERNLYEDMYKIKIAKKQTVIPANIILYRKSYNGYLYESIREWIKDEGHCAIVFMNTANQSTKERFERRGLKVETMYNKQFDDDVEYVNQYHAFRGKLTLVSAYGQVGINLYADENQLVKVYILSNNAMSIIQYSNRIRNKERVDSINIFFKQEEVTNSSAFRYYFDEDSVKQVIYNINSIYHGDSLRNGKHYIKLSRLLPKDCFYEFYDEHDKCHKIMLDRDKYYIFQKIRSVSKYESQMQIIYNRLLDASFEPSIISLGKDVRDVYNSKFKSNFVGQVAYFNFDSLKRDYKGNFYIDTDNDKMLKRFIYGDIKDCMEYIFNYFGKEYMRFQFGNTHGAVEYIKLQWNMFVSEMFRQSEDGSTLTKNDIRDFYQALYYKENSEWLTDSIFAYYIDQNIKNITERHLCQYAANYVALTQHASKDWRNIIRTAELTYSEMKRLTGIIKRFRWMFDWSKSKDFWTSVQETPEIVNFRDKILLYLLRKHNSHARNSKGVEVWRDGAIIDTLISVKDAAKKYNVSTKTIQNYCKSGLVYKKLKVSFRYI